VRTPGIVSILCIYKDAIYDLNNIEMNRDDGSRDDLGEIDYRRINNNTQDQGIALNEKRGPKLDYLLIWLGTGNVEGGYLSYDSVWIETYKPDVKINLVDALRNINYGMCRKINSLINSRMPGIGYEEEESLEMISEEDRWRRMQILFCSYTKEQNWTTLVTMMNDGKVREVLTTNTDCTKISLDHMNDTVTLLQNKMKYNVDDGLPSQYDEVLHGPGPPPPNRKESDPFFAGSMSNNRQLVRDITNSIMAVLTLAD
jgi:hypothetical protein